MLNSAGVGFKPDYFEDIASMPENDLWLEVHTENYLVDGGLRLEHLEKLRQDYPISFHGVSASLGSGKPLDSTFMSSIKKLIDHFQPCSVSEHAVWSRYAARYFPDLLPLPRTQQALSSLVDGISAYQDGIARTILLENPTNYLDFVSEMDEPEFLVDAANRTGCGLLLDVNNLYLSSINCGMDTHKYIDALPTNLVREIHVAGFTPDPEHATKLYIDSHAEPVSEDVWSLLDYALERLGPLPVLVERDDNLPPWAELFAERERAQSIIKKHSGRTMHVTA